MDEKLPAAAAPGLADGPSRPRVVGAFAVVTLAPVVLAFLLIENSADWRLPREVQASALCAAFALFVRGAGLSARWRTVGPGEDIDRRLWGWFLLLVSSILAERALESGMGFLALFYAIAYGMFWKLSRRARHAGPLRTTKIRRFALVDAIVALALFSVAAWLLVSAIDWRESGALAGVLWVFAFPAILFPALIGYLVDAGIRDAALNPDPSGRTALQAIASIAAVLLLVCSLAVGSHENLHVLLSLPIFASIYVLTAVAQESMLAWLGVGEGDSPSHSENRATADEEAPASMEHAAPEETR